MNKKLMEDKGGKLSVNMLQDFFIGMLLVTLILTAAASLVPTAQTAGHDLNATGVPFGSLVASNGILFYAIMGALVITIVSAFLYLKGSRK